MNQLLTILLCGLIAAVANVLGGMVVTVKKKWQHLSLHYFIAFGAGFLLSVVFLEMVPESFQLTSYAPFFILAGYLIVHFFEHTLAPHLHLGEETHREELVHPFAGYSAVLGLGVHNIFDGVSIAAGFAVSPALGFLIFFAVLMHNIPVGATAASIMLVAGRSKSMALGATVIIGILTFIGAYGTSFLSSYIRFTLPLATGVTIYVAASDLIPEVNKVRASGLKMPMMVFVGILLFYLTKEMLELFGV